MRNNLDEDNLYKIGNVVSAKAFPDLKLTIIKYYQRIYYCAVIDEPDRKQLAYFERELIPPTTTVDV